MKGSVDYWLSDRVESGQVPRQVLGRDGRTLVTEWQDEEAIVYQLANKVEFLIPLLIVSIVSLVSSFKCF